MPCSSVAFAYVRLSIALVAIISASDGERAAGVTVEHWYAAADGSRKACSTVKHTYQQELCPCENGADAVIACVRGVPHQAFQCLPYDKGVEECFRRQGFATTAVASVAINNFSLTTFGPGLHASLDHADRTNSSLPHANDSANISEDTPTVRATTPMNAAVNYVYAVIIVLVITPFAIVILVCLVKGKKKHVHYSDDFETGEALWNSFVRERPG